MTGGRRQDILVGVGLGLLGLLFFWRYLFASPIPLIYPVSDLGTDLPREIIPLWMYIKESIMSTGHLPLWRPYSASGAPIIGHPIAPVLYPPHWLSVLLPLSLGLNLDAYLHFWWMGLGMYLVLRYPEAMRWESAAVGAVIFSFAPKWVAHLSGGHWPMLAAIAWWPWAWYGFKRYGQSGKLRWMVLVGVALAAQAINHGSYLALSLIVLGVATVGRLNQPWRGWVRWTAYGWGTAGIVLAGLSAGQILPLLELIPLSNRAALSLTDINFGSLPPSLLLGAFFLPDLKFPEWFIYPGVCALVLATYGWSAGWTRRERWWVIGGLLSITLSLGAFTPVYGELLSIIPGFRFLRVPARWWIFALFFLTMLASWGFSCWLDGKSPGRRRLVWSFGLLTAFSMGGGTLKLINPELFPFNALISAIILLVMVSLLLLRSVQLGKFLIVILIVGEFLWAATNLIRPQVFADLPNDMELAVYLSESTLPGGRSFSPFRSIFPPRLVEYGLYAADGYDSFVLDHYAAYIRRMVGCSFEGYAVSVPPTQSSPAAVETCPDLHLNQALTELLNIQTLILPEPQPNAGGVLAYTDRESWVYDLGPGQGKAFGVALWETSDSKACLDGLSLIDTKTTALVEKNLSVPLKTAPPVILSREQTVNRETFHVRVDEPGLLVRAETWAPGWQVRVAGSQREVLRVNCALQGVYVEKGEQTVQFEYSPLGWRVGLPWSVGTAVFLIIVSVGMFVKRAKGNRS